MLIGTPSSHVRGCLWRLQNAAEAVTTNRESVALRRSDGGMWSCPNCWELEKQLLGTYISLLFGPKRGYYVGHCPRCRYWAKFDCKWGMPWDEEKEIWLKGGVVEYGRDDSA